MNRVRTRPDLGAGPGLSPHGSTELLCSQEAPAFQESSPPRLYTACIFRISDVQEAKKSSKPELVGVSELVSPDTTLSKLPVCWI